jgi:hypothetical protein
MCTSICVEIEIRVIIRASATIRPLTIFTFRIVFLLSTRIAQEFFASYTLPEFHTKRAHKLITSSTTSILCGMNKNSWAITTSLQ